MTRIARFRLGSEMREGKYWEIKEKKNTDYVDEKRNLRNM